MVSQLLVADPAFLPLSLGLSLSFSMQHCAVRHVCVCVCVCRGLETRSFCSGRLGKYMLYMYMATRSEIAMAVCLLCICHMFCCRLACHDWEYHSTTGGGSAFWCQVACHDAGSTAVTRVGGRGQSASLLTTLQPSRSARLVEGSPFAGGGPMDQQLCAMCIYIYI